MTNAKLPVADVYLLAGIADILLWAGYDRAADVLYANLEPEGLLPECDCTGGEWRDVFGS